jgi:hypothetical protein
LGAVPLPLLMRKILLFKLSSDCAVAGLVSSPTPMPTSYSDCPDSF